MGDTRYERHLARLLAHGTGSVSELEDEELIQALAALASDAGQRAGYLANVLASEAMNRLARSHTAVMHAGIGLVALDADGAGVFANPAAERILGWSGRELRGVHVHTLVHDDAAHDGCIIETTLQSGKGSEQMRCVFTRKDGSRVEVELSVAPVEREGMREGVVLAFHPRNEDADDLA